MRDLGAVMERAFTILPTSEGDFELSHLEKAWITSRNVSIRIQDTGHGCEAFQFPLGQEDSSESSGELVYETVAFDTLNFAGDLPAHIGGMNRIQIEAHLDEFQGDHDGVREQLIAANVL